MKGRIDIRVSNNRARFRFTLERNITVVRGDSGTGKTTLYDMIAEYTRLGENSGVQVSAPCPCVALVDMDWQNQLSHTKGSVVFIDEGAHYLASREFAAAIQQTDNYYVIFNRENLHELPYSVEEIYRIKTSNRYHTFEKLYRRHDGYVYSNGSNRRRASASVLLTEDSGAGLQLYQHLYEGTPLRCESAGSNSGIFSWLQENHQEGVFVIADGAAFGAEMDRVMKLQRQYPDRITVCLPESFEWFILSTDVLDNSDVRKVLDNPAEYIDGKDYFSWERYFTHLLTDETRGTYLAYMKSSLNPNYLMGKIYVQMTESLPEQIKRIDSGSIE